MATITMIDYGASNIRSAQKAFEYIGAKVTLTTDPEAARRADKLVLPGVGAFGAGMAALRERGLDTAVTRAAQQNIPLLGICLGMQFLFDESDEMGAHKGLGLIPGKVTRFNEQFTINNSQFTIHNLKVPHMGWNQIEHDESHPLLAGVPSGSYAYFVHSYYCIPANETDSLAFTDYGLRFTSIVGRDNIFGIQFHPEKSQQVGLRILKNFVEMI
ncbi:MAG: imidazole glycerol phosphate synthase subunit HisH [Anaerolineae bacterium]